MWVRSQDKTVLINCNNFSIECYINTNKNKTYFNIETIESNNGTYRTLGSYSSKEKALQVLYMICEQVDSEYPFFMPEDSEVE